MMTRILSAPSMVALSLIAGAAIAAAIISATPSWGHPNHTCHLHSAVAHCR